MLSNKELREMHGEVVQREIKQMIKEHKEYNTVEEDDIENRFEILDL